MAISVMRNRVTTEFRKVESGGDEYLELQAQRDPNDGYPVWEETGMHDAIEQSKRLEAGNPLPTDIGDANQPVGRITGAHDTYVPASMVNDPLPSERESGAEQDREGSSLPLFEDHIAEVPLTAAMESPTDTDVSGTEPDMDSLREKQQASRGASAKSGNGKKSGATSGAASGKSASDQPPGEAAADAEEPPGPAPSEAEVKAAEKK